MKKIIFIAGSGRSGSTLMGKLLDRQQNTAHVGELRHFAQIGYRENRACECGKKLEQCSFWGPIIYQLSRDFDLVEISKISKRLPRNIDLYTHIILKSESYIPSKYIDFICTLYHYIFHFSEAEYIIDSSKFPVHLESLYRTNAFDIRVIHLTRDPRSVADSWSRRKQSNDGPSSSFITTRPAWKVALSWRTCNYLVTRYQAKTAVFTHAKWEDVTRDPSEAIDKIIQSLHLKIAFPGTSRDRSVYLKAGHAFWGNSSRRLSGHTKIINDRYRSYANGNIYDQLIYYISGAYSFGYKKI
jgi:hypothetical protein